MPSVANLETLTRIGFAARGVMYLLIGWIALASGRAANNAELLSYFDSGPGRIALIVAALGFIAYAIWRLSEALLDTEGHGTDAKGMAKRGAGAVSGLIHLALGFTAIRFAMGNDAAARGDGAQEGAATALALPGGQALLTVAAVVLVVAGLYQIVKAVRLDFLKQVDPRCAERAWMRWIGRIGYAARGAVFVVMGWFLWNAASEARAGEAGSTGEAVVALPGLLSVLVAAGLMMFGVFSLIEARYRKINDPRVLDRLGARARAMVR